jgi:hypothetical protein
VRYLLIAVKDKALEAFMPVHCARAQGEAMRNFQDAINDPQNKQLYAHPDDFDLYVIGEMDDTTGKILCPDAPYVLVAGAQAKVRT